MAMPVERLHLERFGPFGDATFDLSPGVNVLLGANSTGKTFAMKALYSVLHALGPTAAPGASPRELVRAKLAGVFRPDDGDVRRLVSRIQGRATARIDIDLSKKQTIKLTVSAGTRPISNLDLPPSWLRNRSAPGLDAPVLFLPSREVLAMYEGFIAAYGLRELSFDETYFDTAVALSATALKGPRPARLQRVVNSLEKELGGRVRLEGSRFYVRGARGRFEAHLLAEGFRKIASIVHLVANGTLRVGGLLIWDEPESSLHPKLAETVVDCLGALAQSGVQIVVATHDYLIADAISRWAQYRDQFNDASGVRFFQLTRPGEQDVVQVETAETFRDLTPNPLLEAFLRHYDQEQRLASQHLRSLATKQRSASR